MESQLLLWFGYAASALIALSMTMSSFIKFRWVNLIGASCFAIYGYLINSLPVIVLNGFIVSVDIYYLFRLYTQNNFFDTIEVSGDNKYLQRFLEYHKSDIINFFPGFNYKLEPNSIGFFVLRNATVVGVFLGHVTDDNHIKVELDYVIPNYRDFKNGKFVISHLRENFKSSGFKKIIADKGSKQHSRYLKKLGFKYYSDKYYSLDI